MKLLGDRIFAKDADGRLLSRIGTLFLKTPGLVTKKGVHAMQRIMWIEVLNEERKALGQEPLTMSEEDAEMLESVDLIFTDDLVLIRPDPERMDLAFRADEELQKLVSKRVIRFLNTHSEKVRRALRERGENWRMARQPISQEDMAELIEKSRVPIGEKPIYYYNHFTGTRYLTASSYNEVEKMSADEFRRQIEEIVMCLSKRNRLGQPEIDLFPLTTPPELRKRFRELKVAELDDAALRDFCQQLATEWRMSMPTELREETTGNFEWRNTMCHVLTRSANDTNAEEQDMIAGIAPEFYRQIEWLPGARIENGEVIFDAIYDEAERTQDPDVLALCDNRVKSFLFNTTRLFGAIDYINIGRIAKSLARHPIESNRRGDVYIMQYRERGSAVVKIQMIRLQKWGVAERLDEGKDLLQAIVETDEYSDFILDRRLMCRQLGMNLPKRLGYGHFTERYRGNNEYNGCAVRTPYFVRSYVPGMASDKVPTAKFRNPAFAHAFASLMGGAAALDMVVGRRNSVTKGCEFDQNYEVIVLDDNGLPCEVKVTDHAGSFTDYERKFEEYVTDYAAVVKRRLAFVSDANAFALAFVQGFEKRLIEVQENYLAHKKAFEELFRDRPYDTNGSGAYRWACALKRLDACNPSRIADALKVAIAC